MRVEDRRPLERRRSHSTKRGGGMTTPGRGQRRRQWPGQGHKRIVSRHGVQRKRGSEKDNQGSDEGDLPPYGMLSRWHPRGLAPGPRVWYTCITRRGGLAPPLPPKGTRNARPAPRPRLPPRPRPRLGPCPHGPRRVGVLRRPRPGGFRPACVGGGGRPGGGGVMARPLPEECGHREGAVETWIWRDRPDGSRYRIPALIGGKPPCTRGAAVNGRCFKHRGR